MIEDDQDTSDLLLQVLTQAGFSVIAADNGADGIALAIEHQPALATVDILMPGMDGLEVTRRIRGLSHTYIVIVSSRSNEADILAGFDAGADDYVPKPIRPRELQARLGAVARRPPTPVLGGPAEAPPEWVLAEEDRERADFLKQSAGGEDAGDGEGKDGEEGMLELGMRFVGSWIEFQGLRINPSRNIVVVDDRLVDLPPEDFHLLATLLYTGTKVLTARQIGLRLRQDGDTSGVAIERDGSWVQSHLNAVRRQIGDTGAVPRWFEDIEPNLYRLVQPQ